MLFRCLTRREERGERRGGQKKDEGGERREEDRPETIREDQDPSAFRPPHPPTPRDATRPRQRVGGVGGARPHGLASTVDHQDAWGVS